MPTDNNTTSVKPGDLRVWHVPQIPCPAFRVPVASAAEGVKLLEVLADYDSFQYEHRIKPDYSNVGGVERYEDDGEGERGWFDVDDDELAGHATAEGAEPERCGRDGCSNPPADGSDWCTPCNQVVYDAMREQKPLLGEQSGGR